ncbi:MAG: hypothetical protein Q9209_006486 [Squamulea sp. 1 TL-2023]
MDFVTLGMFIIDEIHYQPPRKPDVDVMGGAGMYAALGARLFRPPPSASRVGWIVHEGYDFPPHIKSAIESWETNCEFIQTPERETTRACNRYEPNGHRAFKYLNEKIRLDAESLSLAQLASRTYHLVCSAQRCIDLVKGIRAKRNAEVQNQDDAEIMYLLALDPVFIWEPVPDFCTTSELGKCLEALQHVDVFSPNLEEFCSLLGISIDLNHPQNWSQLRQKCKEVIDPRATAVIRLGERGCYIAQPGQQHVRLPAYHEQERACTAIDTTEVGKQRLDDPILGSVGRVIDPTGGGNAFLGGFAIGLLQSGADNIREAAVHGIIAASFIIEQVGVPTIGLSTSRGEIWNGQSVEGRLKEYTRRITEKGNQV